MYLTGTDLACVPVLGSGGSEPCFSYKQTWQYLGMLVQEMGVGANTDYGRMITFNLGPSFVSTY